MANMISNNNNKTNSSTSSGANSSSYAYNNYNNSVSGGESGAGGGVGGGSGRVQTLRDVCNMLMPNQYTIPTGGCAYDHIINLMRDLNLQDDGIVYNTKIKAIETDFCNIVQDETMLCESMEYMNEKALSDSDTALKFALLFSSRNFDALAMKETKVRSAMLKILETNFINADAYRVHDKNRLYNSIILLGEYYNRVRLADHAPITILADSLLNLLIREINDTSVVIGTRLARLVLSQITLNGELMRKTHKEQIDQLLFHVRRHLILQPALTAKVKAMLMMVLDLFYSHFRHIGNELEAMYTDYLVVEEGEEEEDGLNNNQNGGDLPSAQIQEGENGNKVLNSSQEHDSFDSQPTSTKKWSEQVCEDSFCETEGTGADDDQYDNENLVNSYAASSSSQGRPDSNTRGRRTYQPRSAPRPLKQQQLDQQSQDNSTSDQYPSMASSEDRDESKPLPSWRKTRFNRVNNDAGDQHNGRSRNQQRRFSASFDDDQHSVRSEGGPNLRLYSIQDRRKHSQERYERNQVGGLGSNYNSIVNSNWDQRDRDDRSERSYISNYERGNSYKRGGRYNNRNTYDKPPRFQKQQQQQQQQHHHHGQSGGHKIHSDTWRRSNTAVNAYQDENCAYNSNGPDSNSRSSSRARTLPRPAKSQMDDGGRKSNYRFSQSPSHAKAGGSAGSGAQHSFPRYSSQSSLASEASSTFDRRQQHHSHQQPQRHRNFTRRSQPDIHQPQNAGSWQHESPQSQSQSQPSSKDESELVRNAQQTTKYMNYLSAQK